MQKRKKVPNPHDAFFRRTFVRPAVAAEFFRRYLPPPAVARLDLSEVELEEASYVDEKLREHFSDLLFRVRLKDGGAAFIFVLLEHKSAPDERVALQVLRYMVQAWDRLTAPLPLIIPVVVYHGERPWQVGRQFGEMFTTLVSEPFWQRYLPDFKYSLCDLTQFGAAELQGTEGLSPALKVLKYIFRDDLLTYLPEIFDQTVADLPEDLAEQQLESTFRYVVESGKLTLAQVKEAFTQSEFEGGRMPHFLEIIYPERFQAARQEGRQEGRQEATLALTLRQLRQQVGKLDRGLTTQIQTLPFDKLTQLGEALLKFKSREDLEKWLQRAAAPIRKRAQKKAA